MEEVARMARSFERSLAAALSRRAFAGAVFAHGVCTATGAYGQALAPTIPSPSVPEVVVTPDSLLGTVGMTRDFNGRIIAPVFVNGKGPFKFFVDTGANRSALTAALAKKVGAVAVGQGEVHGVSGVKIAPMVTIASMRSGAFEMRQKTIPILGDDLITPADGMLGVDGFDGLRLEFENRYHTMTIRRSHRWESREGFTLRADIRFGQLVSVHGHIGNVNVPIVLDTGAEVALANSALREQLTSPRFRAASLNRARLANAAEPIFFDDFMVLPQVQMQGCEVRNAVAVVGDFHIFQMWDLVDKPALIVGMDVLGGLKSFAIDYGRREVQLRP
jgi:predicted aspartyl protease